MVNRAKAWIDFNGDKTFDPEEVIMDFPEGLPANTMNSEFLVPASAQIGFYRMRIRLGVNGLPHAAPLTGCNSINFGETEDYLIEVVAGDIQICPPSIDVIVKQRMSQQQQRCLGFLLAMNINWR